MRNRTSLKLLLCLSFFGCFNESFSATYSLSPGEDVVGSTFTVSLRPGDSIDTLAYRYDMSVHEILEANPGLGHGSLRVGQKIIIPAKFVLPGKQYRKGGGVVINLSELRLYYFSQDGHYVTTYPVALGRRGWRTPTTTASVVKKAVNPDWHVSKSIKRYHYQQFGKWLPDVVRGGTNANPLGGYALYLSKPGIILHGTNSPMSIGKFVSSGCIRLAPRNIEEIYHHVKLGAPVYIINHAHKAGWGNGELYLESHIPVALNEKASSLNHTSQEQVVRGALSGHSADVQWDRVNQVGSQKRGVPQIVGRLANAAG